MAEPSDLLQAPCRIMQRLAVARLPPYSLTHVPPEMSDKQTSIAAVASS